MASLVFRLNAKTVIGAALYLVAGTRDPALLSALDHHRASGTTPDCSSLQGLPCHLPPLRRTRTHVPLLS